MNEKKYLVSQQPFYEGKANRLYEVENYPQLIVIERKDDISANDGERTGKIAEKGKCNNYISNILFRELEGKGIPTHYVAELSDCHTVIKRTEPIRLEVVMRNIATGSLCRNLPFKDGGELGHPIYELHLKDDARHDPLINETHASALGLASFTEMKMMEDLTYQVNQILTDFFETIGIILVDFKIEFGRLGDGTIVLIDEISPDTCRLWDMATHDKLDKDRFRQNLGQTSEAYVEIYRRILAEKLGLS